MNRVSVVLNGPVMNQLQKSLFPETGHEVGAIVLLGTSKFADDDGNASVRYVSHLVEIVPDDDIVIASRDRFAWRKSTFLRMLKHAMNHGLAIGFVHSHRGLPAFFSGADDVNDREVAELVRNRTRGKIDYVSIVVDETDGCVSRVFSSGQLVPTSSTATVTLGSRWSWRSGIDVSRDIGAFDRQILAFGPAFLKTLGEIRIGIVGAGATDQDCHHAARTQHIEKIEYFTPQREGVHVTASVPTIDLLDRLDSVLLTELVPDETFQPIEGVDHDGFVIVIPIDERFQGGDDVIELRRQRKAITFDFVESIFGLNEDRFGGFAAEGRFADAFDTVQQDARRFRLPAGLDGFE